MEFFFSKKKSEIESSLAPLVHPITGECFGEFNSENEDYVDYNLRWTEDLSNYELMDEKAKAVWKYSPGTVTKSLRKLGEFALYPSGGYVANLGRTLSNSRSILHFLVENDWLDQRTRVVFIEFITYNANRNLFNVVTLMVERSGSTAIVTAESVATVRLLILAEEVNVALNVAFFIALTFIVVHYVRNVFHLKRFTWKDFFSFWNVVDLIIIMLCIASLILYLFRDVYVQELLYELEKSSWNEYVSFSMVAEYDRYFAYALATLVCLSTCRLWRLLHFSKVFRQMEWTLSNSAGPLFSLFILMVVLITMFATYGSLMFGSFAKEFRSSYKTFVTLVLFANKMFPKLHMDRITSEFTYSSILYFIFFWLAYTFYFFNLFFAVLTGRYEMLRLDRAAKEEFSYGPYTYLIEEFTYYSNKLNKNSKVSSTREKRLRGGKESDLNFIALTKPLNTRKCKSLMLREARLEAMALLTLGVVERETVEQQTGDKVVDQGLGDQTGEKAVRLGAAVTLDTADERSKAILAIVLDEMNTLETKGEVYFQDAGKMLRFVTDERLILMETTLNRFTRRNVGFIDLCEDEFEIS